MELLDQPSFQRVRRKNGESASNVVVNRRDSLYRFVGRGYGRMVMTIEEWLAGPSLTRP